LICEFPGRRVINGRCLPEDEVGFHEDRPVNGKLHPFCVPAGRLMIAGGLIPRMITKRFPRHGVTVQNGRELIALSAVKPLEASLRDGSQIGDNDEIPKYPSTKE
jgi:hypothetical protein